MDIAERFNHVRSGNELRLAIEGRFTNLRIWAGKDANGKHKPEDFDSVYMRLDCYKQYSAPLDRQAAGYLLKQNDIIDSLAMLGFPTALENLKVIIELTADMKERDLLEW